jgi:hypothetical protein
MWAFLIVEVMLAVVYARSFGDAATWLMFLSWGLSEMQLLAIEEPLMIIISVLLPSWFDQALANTGAFGAAINATLAKTAGWIASACRGAREACGMHAHAGCTRARRVTMSYVYTSYCIAFRAADH